MCVAPFVPVEGGERHGIHVLLDTVRHEVYGVRSTAVQVRPCVGRGDGSVNETRRGCVSARGCPRDPERRRSAAIMWSLPRQFLSVLVFWKGSLVSQGFDDLQMTRCSLCSSRAHQVVGRLQNTFFHPETSSIGHWDMWLPTGARGSLEPRSLTNTDVTPPICFNSRLQGVTSCQPKERHEHERAVQVSYRAKRRSPS